MRWAAPPSPTSTTSPRALLKSFIFLYISSRFFASRGQAAERVSAGRADVPGPMAAKWAPTRLPRRLRKGLRQARQLVLIAHRKQRC